MKRVIPVEEKRFRVANGDLHRIDMGGNHFINGKCVNPLRSDLMLCDDDVWRHAEIGDTYPIGETIYPTVQKIN